jgi:hypothetical protein
MELGTIAPCGEATDWVDKVVTEVVDRWGGSGGVGIVSHEYSSAGIHQGPEYVVGSGKGFLVFQISGGKQNELR